VDGYVVTRPLVSPNGDRMAISFLSGWCYPAAILGRDGELIQKLSPPGFVDVAPLAWSRDGSRLLYSATRWTDSDCQKHGEGRSDLMVHRQGTRRDQRIVADRNTHFIGGAWSPDGRRIALTECKDADGYCRLVVIDADGKAQRDLGTNLGIIDVYPAKPVWAVKTNEIVTPRQASPPREDTEVWAFNLDSGAGRRIADDGSTDGASVDGSLIADINGVLDVETGQRWPFPANVKRRDPKYGDLVGPDDYFLEERK
jgi:Tol biopolymer transport system component